MNAEIRYADENFVRPAPPVKQLFTDGKWLVPENERPKGWERLGLKDDPPPVKTAPAYAMIAQKTITVAERDRRNRTRMALARSNKKRARERKEAAAAKRTTAGLKAALERIQAGETWTALAREYGYQKGGSLLKALRREGLWTEMQYRCLGCGCELKRGRRCRPCKLVVKAAREREKWSEKKKRSTV